MIYYVKKITTPSIFEVRETLIMLKRKKTTINRNKKEHNRSRHMRNNEVQK
jgi:hypothetical protein